MKAFKLKVADQVAEIEFDLPSEKVNKFSAAVLEELLELIGELAHQSEAIRVALFYSGKKDMFIAGADVSEIARVTDLTEARDGSEAGQHIFRQITRLPFPVIAVIDGICLGGGTEFSLACHYRIGTDNPKTKIGFPEVRLGFLPGWGGTTLTPRLIGLQSSLDLLLSGRNISADSAYRKGLLDKVIPQQGYRGYARMFADEIISGGGNRYLERRRPRGLLNALLEETPIGKKIIYRQAAKNVYKMTKGHYPAPLKIIEVIKNGVMLPIEEQLKLEANAVSELVIGRISKRLVKLFFQTEQIKKDTGTANSEVKAARVKKIGVLGAGIMGGGIAQIASYSEIPVRMKDINQEAVSAGLKAAYRVYYGRVKKRKMRYRELEQKMNFISGTTGYEGFRNIDFVIEAVVENMDIKKAVLTETELATNPDCIFASNTSALSITELATAAERPKKVVGLHFFNPVHRMPLVEVIRGQHTSDETVATTFALAKRLGKTPIVVNDGPGFLVNRLLMPYINEACILLEEGIPAERIDQAMKAFGMPMGPIMLIDEVGIDVAFKVGKIFEDAFGQRMDPSYAIQKIHETGRLGKKGGKGFYDYENQKPRVDPEMYSILGINPGKEIKDKTLIDRMVLAMINEAARCLDEKIVADSDDIDIGMIFGTGFPPFRGGLMHYADDLGIEAIVNELKSFEEILGKRFQPSPLLLEMANNSESFYKKSRVEVS